MSTDNLKTKIIPYEPEHLDEVIALSLSAWAPVFESIQQMMDEEVYQHFYPNGWQASQQTSVESTCHAEDIKVWVATKRDRIVGFVAIKLNQEDSLGEIYMIAVDPDYQRQGISTNLMNVALDYMKNEGMQVVMIDTGGDPGHAPARMAYEKLGFKNLPVARYFKKL